MKLLLLKLSTVTASAVALVAPLGCSSIKSRIYDTDNVTGGERQVECLKGIPMTINAPTHIRIDIIETRYWRDSGAEKQVRDSKKSDSTETTEATNTSDIMLASAQEPANVEAELKKMKERLAELQKQVSDTETRAKLPEQIEKINEDIKAISARIDNLAKTPQAPVVKVRFDRLHDLRVTRSMKYELVTKKELFTTDFKRPASGNVKIGATYGKESGGQYFKTISHGTTDTTITDVGALVSKVAEVAVKLGVSGGKPGAITPDNTGLIAITETVAVEYFDIHQPHVEHRIQEFLERHVNQCSQPCTTPQTSHGFAPVQQQFTNGAK